MTRHFISLWQDRRRRQRGSVLSGTLIITTFVAILAGALMNELSGSFMLTRNTAARLAQEATLNSAAQAAFDQMGATALASGCPSLASGVSLNNLTAVSSYALCAPVVDRSGQQVTAISYSTGAFGVDGTHVQLGALNEYIVGDQSGNVFDYPFGSQTARWTLNITAGSVTAPPAVMPDPTRTGRFLYLVGLSGGFCGSASYCVGVWTGFGSAAPVLSCTYPSAGAVSARFAPSPNYSGIAFFGDAAGNIYDFDAAPGNCDSDARKTVSTSQPIVAITAMNCPLSRCQSGTDAVYATASDGSSSQMFMYTYRSASLNLGGSAGLNWPSAVGQTVNGSNIVVTFTAGGVQMLSVNGASIASSALRKLPSAISAAPGWCQCPNGTVLGVGTAAGLYLLNGSLGVDATYLSGIVNSAPSADQAGDWFFGADDGALHEVPAIQSTPTVINWGSGLGRLRSSAMVGGCTVNGISGLCAYFGSTNGNAYLVQFDARNVVINSCLSSCSSPGLRLWTKAQVAPSLSPPVSMTGFSFYSA